ncbi:MAG: PQQ-dependent sugar dehydrogenase [Sphingomonas sp.]
MRKYALPFLGCLVLVLLGFWYWASRPDVARLPFDAVVGARPAISDPRPQVYPTINVAKAVGWPQGGAPTPAAGLKLNAFANGLDHPRWLYRLPNGDVLVAETNSPPRHVPGIQGFVESWLMKEAGAAVPSANRITLLRDTNGDGVADVKTPLITGLNSPLGMLLLGDMLYIADTDALVRVPYKLGDTHIAAKPELVVHYPGSGQHWARGLIASQDGKTVFVSVGSSTNIADDGMDAEVNRACILEIDPEHKTARVYAAGLRNPQGMAIDPKTGRLWTVVNERDMLGSDLTPDYLTAVELGDYFGWPYSYWGGYVDKRVQPERPDLLQYAKRPDYALGAHVAPLGLAMATDAKLGNAFTNGVFVGEHGSWNRVPASGYKVVYVPFGDNGFPAKGAKPVDVLTGFLNKDGKAQGRPVGVITDATGALLVADDVGNMIWRVSAAR